MAESLPTRMKDANGRVHRWSEKAGGWVPLQDIGAAEGVLLGVGQRFSQIGQGLGLLDEQDTSLADEGLSAEAPISSGIGNVIPDIIAGGGVGGGLVRGGASLATRAKSLFAVAGVEGALGAAAPGTASERLQAGLTNAAFGVAGAGTGAMAFRIADRIRASRQAINPGPFQGQGAPFPDQAPGGFGPGSAGAAEAPGADIFQEPGAGPFDQSKGFLGIGGDDAGASINQLEAIENGIKQGVVFEPGMVDNNLGQRQIFAAAKSNPLTADIVDTQVTRKNKDLYEATTLRALGEKPGRGFTQDTLAEIDQRIDGTFADIYDRNPGMDVDKVLNADQVELFNQPPKTIGTELNGVIDDHIGSIRYEGKNDPTVGKIRQTVELIQREAAQDGQVSSQTYGRMRSELRKEHRRQVAASNHNAADTLSEAVNKLDDWFSESVTGADKNLFHKTLQQYRLLQSVDRPNSLSNAMTLRPGNIASNLKKNYKVEFARNNRFFEGGREKNLAQLDPEIKKFFDLTKTFAAFPEVVGDSGTATRSFMTAAMADPTLAVGSLLARQATKTGIKRAQPDLKDIQMELARQRQRAVDLDAQ